MNEVKPGMKFVSTGLGTIPKGTVLTAISMTLPGWWIVKERPVNFDWKLCDPQYYTSYIDPIETAKQTLIDAGWTVTPPKPKVSGTVAIIKDVFGKYRAERGYLLTNGKYILNDCIPKDETIVARLTWTEGDGLSESGKS